MIRVWTIKLLVLPMICATACQRGWLRMMLLSYFLPAINNTRSRDGLTSFISKICLCLFQYTYLLTNVCRPTSRVYQSLAKPSCCHAADSGSNPTMQLGVSSCASCSKTSLNAVHRHPYRHSKPHEEHCCRTCCCFGVKLCLL